MKKRRKTRYAYYAETKVGRPKLPFNEWVWPKAQMALTWPADCRWWNYSDRPAPYKPGAQR